MKHAPRMSRRRWWVAGTTAGVAGLTAVAVLGLGPAALAASLFSDNFEGGLASSWSKSGGTWSVVTDGSQVLQESSSSSDLAREFNGSTGWTDYSLQASVKALAFGSSDGLVGISARTASSSKFYRLGLNGSGQAVLQAYAGSSSITTLGSASIGATTGTWYTLRLDVSGNTVTGYVNGTQVASASSTLASSGRISMQTIHASGEFDDVTVTSSVTSSPTPTTASPTPTSTGGSGNPPPTTGLVGWATQNGGTTGGGSGPTVTVTSLSALTTEAASSTAETIRVSGNFTCSDDVRLASNKTIVGVGSNSGLTGCGLNMKSVRNDIVRNMQISKVLAGNGNGDAIHIEKSTNLWIDHNDLSSDTTHGTDYYDGLLDITHAADFITVSWNKLHDHIKCSLVGHSDSNASEDTGHLRVTYHHNWFSDCAERNPRVRFGNPVHVFNNYYNNGGYSGYNYGVASTCGAGVLVEGNYFEDMTDPTHTQEGSSPSGNIVERDNVYVNSGTPQTAGSVAPIPYSYTMDPAANVKSIVTSGAGTGRI